MYYTNSTVNISEKYVFVILSYSAKIKPPFLDLLAKTYVCILGYIGCAGQPRWLSGLTRSCVHSLWLLVDHCVLSNWDRILVRAVKGLISRAGMVSICPLLWQRDVKLQQTNNIGCAWGMISSTTYVCIMTFQGYSDKSVCWVVSDRWWVQIRGAPKKCGHCLWSLRNGK